MNERMKGPKKRLAALAALFSLSLFGLVYGFAIPSNALAWENCPKGLVNDPYPGACGRYVDTNGDDICDLSQPKPADTTTTTVAVVTTTTGEPPTGDCPLGPCAGCGACLSPGVPAAVVAESATDATTSDGGVWAAVTGGATLAAAEAAGSTTTSTTVPPSAGDGGAGTVAAMSAETTEEQGGVSFFTHYLVSPIALGFFIIYGASFFLYKTKRIRIATHRKVWNVLLLGTFLVTGIFGVILAIQLDYPLPFRIPIDLLFWHVEAGIAMTLISLFHMGWHFNYYKNLVRRTRERTRAVRETEKALDLDERRLVTEARAQRQAERDARRLQRQTPPAARPARPPRSWMEPKPE
jgi:hypothetical protein